MSSGVLLPLLSSLLLPHLCWPGLPFDNGQGLLAVLDLLDAFNSLRVRLHSPTEHRGVVC